MSEEFNECPVCGVGEYLPSRVCDHCNSKADDNPQTPRPIATAPQDGTRLLLFYEGMWVIGNKWVSENKWLDDGENYCLDPAALTHWLPLPPDP